MRIMWRSNTGYVDMHGRVQSGNVQELALMADLARHSWHHEKNVGEVKDCLDGYPGANTVVPNENYTQWPGACATTWAIHDYTR